MSPRATRPKTNFFGAPYRFFNLDFPGRAILQFHNLQPGEFSNPADLIRAQQPFILPPRPAFPQWLFGDATFGVGFRQDFVRIIINTNYRPLGNPFFTLELFLGVHSFGYNQIQDPAGVFAFGGTVTISWEGLPPQ